MRLVLILLMSLHGFIHLMGFVKAFNLSEIKALNLPISKPLGIVWGISFLLFAILILMYAMKNPYWWLIGFLAVFISQLLIIHFWQDAKFGTIANVIILLAVIAGYGNWSFENSYKNEVQQGLKRTSVLEKQILKEKDIEHLPSPVQQYLRYVGVINQPKVNTAKIIFSGKMRSKDQDWFDFTSEQYSFFDQPERLFFMKAKIKGLPTSGFHFYKNKKARMNIKLLSLFSIVNIEGKDLFKAETVTVFNDMCILAPASLIDPRIKWKSIDETSTQATFTNNGVSISATLYFNKQGQLINFISDDRFEINENKSYRFSTPISEYRKFGNYKLMSYGEAIWHYPEGEFVYGKFWRRTSE